MEKSTDLVHPGGDPCPDPAWSKIARAPHHNRASATATVAPLLETQARQVLTDRGSSAANAIYFQAKRRVHWWAFGWRPEAGEVFVGTLRWVATDDDQAGWCRLSEAADDTINRLMLQPA